MIMSKHRAALARPALLLLGALAFATASPSTGWAQQAETKTPAEAKEAGDGKKPFNPYYGMPGRDAVWVPTPYELIEKMLDMAKVTEHDLVMDLGSGDGRNIIAAAKRGARAIGVEYNGDLVALSQKTAEKEGVAGKASFVQGDMYKADISKASVLALFLLPENMDKMVDKFLAMKPGSRIVVNGFRINHWDFDASETISGECKIWCTAYLWIVPADVRGRWRMADGELQINQRFQKFTGTLTRAGKSAPVTDGKLDGTRITFNVAGVAYTGRVEGDSMTGSIEGSAPGMLWNASRAAK
jgi:precorrin-6B methylase 2